MKPSEARELVLGGHLLLRRIVEDIERLAVAELDAPGSAVNHLRSRALELVSTFFAHLDLEERVLVPVLSGIDAWGPVRVERLLADHVQQRQRMQEVRTRCGEAEVVDDGALARALLQLALELAEDMAWEEREMLHPDLLRDDIIEVKQFGG